jgi:putative nucleotidyltransferase with HDIG domain
VGGELAFNAGLLHDIGKLAFSLIMPDEYLSTYKEQQKLSVPFIEIERNYLPFSHTVFGEALAQQWNLPEVISDSIAFHHTPGNSQLHPELAATVCLADELSHAINTSDNHTAVSLDVFDAVNPSACAVLGLQRREIHELVDICKAELVKARFLHEIEIS